MRQGGIWWGEYDVGLRQTRRWCVGPFTLWVTRGDGEWRVARQVAEDAPETRVEAAVSDHEPTRDDLEVSRFATQSSSTTLQLVPAMANRPVIVKTDRPFYVPNGEEATLFVSVPVWLRLLAGDHGTELLDVPILRPSDTWFGPNTLSGELCYATRSRARLRLENLPLRPHRAITAALVRNHAESTLHLERLKVPVGNLSLFASADGHLWTESLTLERHEDSESARVHLQSEPDNVVIERRLADPRQHASRGFLLDAFGGLFTRRGDKKDGRVSRKPRDPAIPDV